jgi:hypothetical protein
MTGLTDVRDRTLTMLRALGIEPDRKQMRTVEKYVRWVDGQIIAAHIDGRAMDRDIARGHEMTVTHDPYMGGTEYTVTCHEPSGADCRLVCAEGCAEWSEVKRDSTGPHHLVNADPTDEAVRHRMVDAGHCNAAEWLTNGDAGIADLGVSPAFEVGRFPIRPVWTGHSYVWEKA